MNLHHRFSHRAMLGAFATLLGVLAILPAFANDAPSPQGNIVHLKRFEEAERPVNQFLAQSGVELKDGETYMLTFWAKASPSLQIRLQAKDTQTWGGVGSRLNVEVSTGWQKFELEFSGDKANPGHTRLEFHFADKEPGEFWLADIQVRPSGGDEKPETNLITNGRFEDNLTKWYSEGRKESVFQIEVQSLADANAVEPK